MLVLPIVAQGVLIDRQVRPDASALSMSHSDPAAQAMKQQMRLRYPEYNASPDPSPANVSVSGNSRP